MLETKRIVNPNRRINMRRKHTIIPEIKKDDKSTNVLPDKLIDQNKEEVSILSCTDMLNNITLKPNNDKPIVMFYYQYETEIFEIPIHMAKYVGMFKKITQANVTTSRNHPLIINDKIDNVSTLKFIHEYLINWYNLLEKYKLMNCKSDDIIKIMDYIKLLSTSDDIYHVLETKIETQDSTEIIKIDNVLFANYIEQKYTILSEEEKAKLSSLEKLKFAITVLLEPLRIVSDILLIDCLRKKICAYIACIIKNCSMAELAEANDKFAY